jgi:hypothetical protein
VQRRTKDPTGVEGQWGSQTPHLPTYCHLATTDTIARLAQIEEHAAPTAHSAPHMPYRKTPLWCGYPRFNHRTGVSPDLPQRCSDCPRLSTSDVGERVEQSVVRCSAAARIPAGRARARHRASGVVGGDFAYVMLIGGDIDVAPRAGLSDLESIHWCRRTVQRTAVRHQRADSAQCVILDVFSRVRSRLANTGNAYQVGFPRLARADPIHNTTGTAYRDFVSISRFLGSNREQANTTGSPINTGTLRIGEQP